MFYTYCPVVVAGNQGIAKGSNMERIATFETPIQAHIARNKLEAAGIVATISNEMLVGNAWHFGSAVGGVQLHVGAENVEAALKILSEQHPSDNHDASLAAADGDDTQEFTEEDFKKDWDEEEEDDSETTLETEADRLAKRASKSGLLGLILPFLQIYTFWLLLLFCFEPTKATARSRWRIVFAWVACLLVCLLFWQLLIIPSLVIRK